MIFLRMCKVNLLVELGKEISKIRKSKNLSQESLADKCSLHRTYIGCVERGERNITIKSLHKICLALGISIREIFENK